METLSPKYSCSCSDKQPKLSPEGVPSLRHITFQTAASQSYNAWHTDYIQSNNYVTEDKCSRNDINTSSRELRPSHCRINPMLSPLRKKIVHPLLFSLQVLSDSLQPHGLQHTRLASPSLSPGVCSNSCPLSQGCHPTISSSFAHFSSCPQSFPASGSFPSTLGIVFWCIRGVHWAKMRDPNWADAFCYQ